jgi:N-acetylmuramoyl-L-alanine amidase
VSKSPAPLPVVTRIWPPTVPAEVLACTAWMEDASGGKEGMQAVMSVVLNRARSDIVWWGKDIRSVCLAPEQFSSWNPGSILVPKVMAAMDNGDEAYAIALNLAELAVQGILPDTTQNSDSYFAVSIAPPKWAARSKFVVQIAGQRYYRLYLSAPNNAAGVPAT